MPQSVCTRYGLAVGYYSSWLVRVLMIVACPVAWPLGKLLDYVLGHGEHALPRSQLQHYVALHSEDEGFAHAGEGLTANELLVINSALELTSKTARTAMTPLDKVFMVCQDDVMDEAMVHEIMHMGHSRLPVHAADDRTNIVGLVLVKELLLNVSVRCHPAVCNMDASDCSLARLQTPFLRPLCAQLPHACMRARAGCTDKGYQSIFC